MSRTKQSESARVLEYFETADIKTAVEILGIVASKVRQRVAKELSPAQRPAARKPKAKAEEVAS